VHDVTAGLLHAPTLQAGPAGWLSAWVSSLGCVKMAVNSAVMCAAAASPAPAAGGCTAGRGTGTAEDVRSTTPSWAGGNELPPSPSTS